MALGLKKASHPWSISSVALHLLPHLSDVLPICSFFFLLSLFLQFCLQLLNVGGKTRLTFSSCSFPASQTSPFIGAAFCEVKYDYLNPSPSNTSFSVNSSFATMTAE